MILLYEHHGVAEELRCHAEAVFAAGPVRLREHVPCAFGDLAVATLLQGGHVVVVRLQPFDIGWGVHHDDSIGTASTVLALLACLPLLDFGAVTSLQPVQPALEFDQAAYHSCVAIAFAVPVCQLLLLAGTQLRRFLLKKPARKKHQIINPQ